MDAEQLNQWLPPDQQQQMVSRLIQRVGVTRVRAECFVRLWVYLWVKQKRVGGQTKPPMQPLEPVVGPVSCTLREAAELFYNDKEQGSDRAAGMMLDKLAALGLITKHFDGNTTLIEVQPIPEIAERPAGTRAETKVEVKVDAFDPRCDAIPVANLLAANYNWMNHSTETLPHRIVQLLRSWAKQYSGGMRVLRRCDTLNPVGFFLLYPTAAESEALFFGSPNKGLHLSTLAEVDPFKMALPGDPNCVSVYVRSWMIEPSYHSYQGLFLHCVQETLRQMQQDFPNLCDLHTLIIHPSYESLAAALGFQKTGQQPQSSLYWMYLPLDRFLGLDVERAIANLRG
ncbi:MAG TPA: hypothetical protein V6D07_06140 [Trichocoleus sp.]